MTFYSVVSVYIDLLKFETCSSALRNSEMANTTCGSLAGLPFSVWFWLTTIWMILKAVVEIMVWKGGIRNRPFPSSPDLCITTRLSAQPLIWKWFFILMQVKLIFTRKVVHLASFWKWGFLELGSALFDEVSILLHGFCTIRVFSERFSIIFDNHVQCYHLWFSST